MTHADHDFAKDIERVKQIPMIATLLDVVCQTTGMGFAAVARVTNDRWIACSVRDDIQFGLVAGSELPVETTICSEIRDSHQAVVIDHVQKSGPFCNHPTPTMYGFQSYISFPIFLKNGEFFGTLCAIDPQPAQLENSKIKGMFSLFADLISFHLQQIELLEQSQVTIAENALAHQKLKKSESHFRSLSDELEQQVQARTQQLEETVRDLQRSNENLQQFAYIASHDLQEPLRKIQSFSNLLQDQYGEQLGTSGFDYLERMHSAGARMSALIRDLLTYSRISTRQQEFGLVSLETILASVLVTLDWTIKEREAQIRVEKLPVIRGDESQLGQLFQNLLSNALKFTPAGMIPRIQIRCVRRERSELPFGLRPTKEEPFFYEISVSDQGVGFDMKYLDRVFQVFQRLHGKNDFPGTGVGLAICLRVVENHGGAITARSQPGKGATFYVYLPA